MYAKFPCPECGRSVYTTKPPGQPTRCTCGADVVVPGDAETGELAAKIERPPAHAGRDLDVFRVGRVLGRSLGIWFRNLVPFGGLALLLYVPVYLLDTEFFVEPLDWFETALRWLVDSLAGQLLAAILIDAVFQVLRERRPEMERSVRNGFRALPRVFLVWGLCSLVMAVFGGAIGLVAAGAGMDDHPFLALVLVLVMLYLIMWFAVRFWAAVAVSVVEDPGITAAIQRSWSLSEGVRMRIFLVLLVVAVLGYLVSIPVGFLIRPLSLESAYAIELGLSAVLAAFGSVVLSVGYHDLRQAQEGVATDELAAIFE